MQARQWLESLTAPDQTRKKLAFQAKMYGLEDNPVQTASYDPLSDPRTRPALKENF